MVPSNLGLVGSNVRFNSIELIVIGLEFGNNIGEIVVEFVKP